MEVQIPTKLRRNAPCPCGSGRKFKKCCGMEKHKMEEEPKLKNEFRKEIRDPYAGIPEDELVTRDQEVLRRELVFRINGFKADHEHIAEAVEHAKETRMGLLALPKSPGRESAIKCLDGQIENLGKQLETLKPTRQMLITLLALEELFEKPTVIIEPSEQKPPVVITSAQGANEDEDVPDELADEPVEVTHDKHRGYVASDSGEAPELSDE